MNTLEVTKHIQVYLYEHSHIYQASNYSKTGYYESDILAITNSLLVTEIEVKVSRSDFIADFKKKEKHYKLDKRINHLYCKIPNRFYYACPDNLIFTKDVPGYAGLLWVCKDGSIMVIKKAPLLHKEKAGNKLLMGLLSNLSAKVIFGCQYMTYKNRINKEKYKYLDAA